MITMAVSAVQRVSNVIKNDVSRTVSSNMFLRCLIISRSPSIALMKRKLFLNLMLSNTNSNSKTVTIHGDDDNDGCPSRTGTPAAGGATATEGICTMLSPGISPLCSVSEITFILPVSFVVMFFTVSRKLYVVVKMVDRFRLMIIKRCYNHPFCLYHSTVFSIPRFKLTFG